MIFFLICAILVVIIVLFFIFSHLWKEKRVKKYIRLFTEEFNKTGDIKATMVSVSSCYGKRKKERKALEAGIYYLEHSLLRDYASSLSYIYDVFDNLKLNQMVYHCHEQAIKTVQKNRRLLLAPPK